MTIFRFPTRAICEAMKSIAKMHIGVLCIVLCSFLCFITLHHIPMHIFFEMETSTLISNEKCSRLRSKDQKLLKNTKQEQLFYIFPVIFLNIFLICK